MAPAQFRSDGMFGRQVGGGVESGGQADARRPGLAVFADIRFGAAGRGHGDGRHHDGDRRRGRRSGGHDDSGRHHGHWRTISEQVHIPGFWRQECVPATYGWRRDACGRAYWGVVTPAHTHRVWVPPRCETRTRQVWVPC